MTEPTSRANPATRRLSNRELIAGLVDAAPDHPLWRELLTRFRPRVRLVVFRSYQAELARGGRLEAIASGDAVEDLVQEVFVRLIEGDRRALARFEGRSEQSAFTYVSTIAANIVRDHFKKLRALKNPRATTSLSSERRVGRDPDARMSFGDTIAAEGPGPDRFVAAKELRTRIEGAIDELSPRGSTSARDRLIFRLYFLEGLTIDEIAAVAAIKLSASGVEKCIRRIRDAVKDRISEPAGRTG